MARQDAPRTLWFMTQLLRLSIVASVCLAFSAFADPPAGYRLAWSDEFDGSALDQAKWSHYGLGKRRDSINTADAVGVANGMLTITSYTSGATHHTGMISTRGKFEPIHGYWEARIRYDDSPGQWSAFWLMTPTMAKTVGDPGASGTEIDICEHRVRDQKGSNIAGCVQQTLHWDGYGKAHKSKGHLTGDLGIGTGFHLYALEWTTNEYKFLVDGKVTWTSTNAISHAKEFCILSSEIKDKGWAGNIPEGGYGDLAQSKKKMIVDWVRYYSRD